MFSLLRTYARPLLFSPTTATPQSNVRYIRTMKEINETRKLYKPPAAKDLIALVEPIEVDGNVVSCDGGDPDLGHPRVYLNLEHPGKNACGYCGQVFVKKPTQH